jgi:hypothetical protein
MVARVVAGQRVRAVVIIGGKGVSPIPVAVAAQELTIPPMVVAVRAGVVL